jgi:hypothetical protein
MTPAARLPQDGASGHIGAQWWQNRSNLRSVRDLFAGRAWPGPAGWVDGCLLEVDRVSIVILIYADLIATLIFGLVVAALVRLGFRAGDQRGDATAQVSLTWVTQPDGDVLHATVAVQNPAPTPVTVSVHGGAVPSLALLFCDPRRTHVPIRERRQLTPAATVLGAVDGGGEDWWRIPLAIPRPGSAAKVVVRLDQKRDRTRFREFLIRVPRKPWIPRADVPYPIEA